MQASLSALTFGAEFETVCPLSRANAAAFITRTTGIPVHSAIGGVPAGMWSIVADGSITGGNGLEFVSPILSGEAGLEQVAKVVNALAAMNCTVNTSTGFHVHVGVGRNAPVDMFKNLIKLYGRFETAIDSMMAPSRRANRAYYCRSVAAVNLADIERASSVTELASMCERASGASGRKYHKVNIVPMGKPTVEFRHHAGTVSAAKAVNWIVTCLGMVNAAKLGRIGTGTATTIARDVSQFELKTRTVIEMISRPEGASLAEICAAGNWQRMGIKRHAAIAGFTFRKRGDRFFITSEAAAVDAVPATLDGLASLIEATPEQRAFFATRVSTLR